jgi:hypothetical protein
MVITHGLESNSTIKCWIYIPLHILRQHTASCVLIDVKSQQKWKNVPLAALVE